MAVPDPADLGAFRLRLRAWLASELGGRPASEFASRAARSTVHGQMYDAGLTALTWPERFGGGGLSSEFQTVFNEETAPYSHAMPDLTVSIGICAAILLEFGTPQQQAQHLPRMLRADEQWTQLLSEPGAGSDLASVSTRADVAAGGGWVLTGQKVWTSRPEECQYALALVRTDRAASRHRGLTMVIVRLDAPGVVIRPLRQMTGEHEFSEVFLDDVQVGADAVVGEVNGGWAVLMRMLFHERIAIAAGTVGQRMGGGHFAGLVSLARDCGAIDEPSVRDVLVDLYTQERILDWLGIRIRAALESGDDQRPIGSLGKLGTAAVNRLAGEVAVRIVGARGQAWQAPDWQAAQAAHALLESPRHAIAGGTTEIQKNTIAERLLGLPREATPRPG
jgi:alkylation response protein AidB-like acyl-CoA dehydrogenase